MTPKDRLSMTTQKMRALQERRKGEERQRERAYALEEFKCLQCLEGMYCLLKHNRTRHKHMLLLFSAAVAPLLNVKAPLATEAMRGSSLSRARMPTGHLCPLTANRSLPTY